MSRLFAVLLCLALVGGTAAADERSGGITARVDRVIAKQRLVQMLLAVKDRQERIGKELKELHRKWEEDALAETPALGGLDEQRLAKGETKKLKHTIRWRLYKEDALKVKVTASDESITVPGEIKLTFEKNEFSFEYEVRAGNKEGTFKVTLTPEVGKAVEVKVTVK